jgi:hypothetical protein
VSVVLPTLVPWTDGVSSRTRQRANTWKAGRAILNGVGARQPEHICRIPVQARVEWVDTGEEWIETIALGWSGDLVYVDMWGTGYGLNACWLRADDVKRRTEAQ